MAARGDIAIYGDPDDGIRAPTGITVAPDGDVWFTSIGSHRVGRVRVGTGTVETFVDPSDRIRLPANIIPAADGRLWFTCLGSGMLASIDPEAPDPAETITHHAHSDLDGPVAIKSGPDGRLWFTSLTIRANWYQNPRAGERSPPPERGRGSDGEEGSWRPGCRGQVPIILVM